MAQDNFLQVEAQLMSFFKEYGESFRNGAKLSEFYGDCALASTPAFVGCLKGEAEVHAALVNVAKGQVRTGMQSLTAQKVEIINIDSIHWWAHIYWGAKFARTGDQLIEFDISYLVRRINDHFKILLYVAHQDEQKIRQGLGLT